jgi:hypothetical protein
VWESGVLDVDADWVGALLLHDRLIDRLVDSPDSCFEFNETVVLVVWIEDALQYNKQQVRLRVQECSSFFLIVPENSHSCFMLLIFVRSIQIVT